MQDKIRGNSNYKCIRKENEARHPNERNENKK